MSHRAFRVFATVTAFGILFGVLRVPAFCSPPPTTMQRIASTADSTVTRTSTWPVPRIEEDDPAWDCTSMGNRRCGP